MPNCKYDDPRLCDARHINALETLAQIARTLSRKSKPEKVLLEVSAICMISGAARALSITEHMVRYKIQDLNIDYKTLFKKREGDARRETLGTRH